MAEHVEDSPFKSPIADCNTCLMSQVVPFLREALAATGERPERSVATRAARGNREAGGRLAVVTDGEHCCQMFMSDAAAKKVAGLGESRARADRRGGALQRETRTDAPIYRALQC